MKQLIQNLQNGETSLVEVPSPNVSSNNLLIHSTNSLISAGTEKMLVDFAKSGYLAKARQQPDKVKEVIDKIKNDGFSTTYEAVKSKLSQPITLGYCNVGKVVEIGHNVNDFSVGDRVVSNGSHSEVVSVSKNLCAQIPDNVTNEEASFTVLAAIGLQGIRLAKPTLGESFAVIGLGSIGLLTVQMLIAQGCRVLAIDIQDERLQLAKDFGATTINPKEGNDVISFAKKFSRGQGIDGVIITASTKSNEVISQAANICRKRGRIVLVGVTGLDLSRDDFYEKELSFQVSCSYGPGRYDPNYEEGGNDYPIAFVRWTEQRNFEAVLDLMSSKKINLAPLISHRIPFEDAPKFYSKISEGEQGLGMLIEYSSSSDARISKTITLPNNDSQDKSSYKDDIVLGFIGAGNYASRVLIPTFKSFNTKLHSVVTSNGLSGTIHGINSNFKYSSTNINDIISNDEINTIAIATRHDSHSDLICQAIDANKNVFVEKPMAIDRKGLQAIKNLNHAGGKSQKKKNNQIMVGFNRRFSPHIIKMKSLLDSTNEPKTLVMTMNAGSIPENHWVHDTDIGGGRIIGEACHYIDLMRYLVGFEITNAVATCMGKKVSGKANDDNASITINFADGSFGTINYFSNGSSSFPKEAINVFSGGKVLSLDNFRVLRGFGWKNFRRMRTWQQDKGQKNCIKSFLDGIKTNKPAIPFNELYEVASLSIDIAENLRKQS
ncbi:MAG: dehydrogenase [Candidatus Marinimicrobia bacterium]|nr:dehydrogenase [Candidatus Neomarinimicrobiota bacterium]